MNACTSNCDQGRKACPCPYACELPDPDSLAHDLSTAIIYAAVALCLLLVAAAIFWR